MNLSETALKIMHQLGGGDPVAPADLTTVAAILLVIASAGVDPRVIAQELLAYLEGELAKRDDRDLQKLWQTGWATED